jgi:hypothetical protein
MKQSSSLSSLEIWNNEITAKIQKNKSEETDIYNSSEYLTTQKRIQENKEEYKALITEQKNIQKQIQKRKNDLARKAQKVHLAEMEKEFQLHHAIYVKKIYHLHSEFNRVSDLMKNLDKHFNIDGILTKNDYNLQMNACKLLLENLKKDFQQLIEPMARTCDHDPSYHEGYYLYTSNDTHWTKLHRFIPIYHEDQIAKDLHMYLNNYNNNKYNVNDLWYCICTKCKKIKEFDRDRCN